MVSTLINFENGERKFMENKKPNTFFICCCDNRIMPYSITNKEQGELFILRNVGNIIPPYNSPESSVAAAIAYAIGHLEIPEIIVCGHSDCGGMKAALAGIEDNSTLKNWLQYAAPSDSAASPDELSKTNVLHQIENLKTHPDVIKALDNERLKIHAWWFDLETNTVHDLK